MRFEISCLFHLFVVLDAVTDYRIVLQNLARGIKQNTEI